MKTIFAYDPWRLVENELHKDDMRLSESMTSIGNGHMGMRGNFEERYSGDSHRGTYLAGVWFPDKTRVGWWKNGYPQYFGKVINAMNIISLRVRIDREDIDLFEDDVLSFQRVLDMRAGVLSGAEGISSVPISNRKSLASAMAYATSPSWSAFSLTPATSAM